MSLTMYREALELEERMRPMNQGDEYYKLRELLVKILKDLLRTEFTLMPKDRLLKFLSLCSTYRPEEPFQVLGRIGSQLNERTERLNP